MAQAFYDLLVEYLPRLRAHAALMTRNRPDADDVVQDTVVKALRAESQFTPGTNFGAWVHRILRNEFISSHRRSKRAPKCIDEVPIEVFSRSGTQESELFCQEILRAMEVLRDDEREILIMICAGDCSYEQAAETLVCSVGTVKSRLWRARAKLKKMLLTDERWEGSGSLPTAMPASGTKSRHPDRNSTGGVRSARVGQSSHVSNAQI